VIRFSSSVFCEKPILPSFASSEAFAVSLTWMLESELTGSAIAQMLGLSKSHVRNVLNGAENLGALIHDERRRDIQLSVAFLAEARASFVHLLTLMALAHQRACVLARDRRLEVGRDENA